MIDWMKYAEIQALKNKGFKKANVAKKLNINRKTVAKYWDMPPDMTAAQIYDWCKERSPLEPLDFQKRSFQSYVNSIREEHSIQKPVTERQYEAVDERAPGAQGQVDMGEIYVPTEPGKRKRVYCFAMVIAHSHYKFVLWQEKPFTTASFIRAHIKAFDYFGGRPHQIVYNQDKVLAVSEQAKVIVLRTVNLFLEKRRITMNNTLITKEDYDEISGHLEHFVSRCNRQEA